MEFEYIEENDVIERYLAQALPTVESDAFEARLLWCAKTREALDLARALTQGLQDVPEEVRDATRAAAKRSSQPKPYLALAATAVLSAGLMWLVTSGGTPTAVDGDVLASAGVFELTEVRSRSPVAPVVSLAEDDQWTMLVLYPAFADFSGFDVHVERHDAGDSWALVTQRTTGVGDQESLGLMVKTDDLRPAGDYRVRLIGHVRGGGDRRLAQTIEFKTVEATSGRNER